MINPDDKYGELFKSYFIDEFFMFSLDIIHDSTLNDDLNSSAICTAKGYDGTTHNIFFTLLLSYKCFKTAPTVIVFPNPGSSHNINPF